MNANIYRRPHRKKERRNEAQQRRKRNFISPLLPCPLPCWLCSMSTIKIKETAIKRQRNEWDEQQKSSEKLPHPESSQWNRVKICIRNHFYAMEMIRRTQRPPPHIARPPPRYHRAHATASVGCESAEINSSVAAASGKNGGISFPMPSRVKLKAFIERFTITTPQKMSGAESFLVSLCLFISLWFDRSHICRLSMLLFGVVVRFPSHLLGCGRLCRGSNETFSIHK